MKFYTKALVAAVALSVSTMASAALPATSASGDGALVLSLLDRTNNKFVFFDTGFKYSDLSQIGAVSSDFDNSNSSLTFDLSSNAGYQSFISAATSTNTFYTIFAGDKDGFDDVTGEIGVISSYVKPLVGNVPALDTSTVVTFLGQHDTAIAEADFGTPARLGQFYARNQLGSAGPRSTALIGTQTNLIQYANNDDQFTTSAYQYQNTVVNFNNGLLTISSVTTPVPEAETYAMLMAGLGLIGGLVRRRKTSK